MNIALFGRNISSEAFQPMNELFDLCNEKGITVAVYQSLWEKCKKCQLKVPDQFRVFGKNESFEDIDVVFSIGGDGTFLRTARLVGHLNIPIAGINTGRLGFLADKQLSELRSTLEEFIAGDVKTEQRMVLKVEEKNAKRSTTGFALNDISVLRRDTSSLIVVHAYANDKLLNSFWADGLIISTPTGSTAYSMSAGGPIVYPESGNIIITPIAPHSLTVRPIVIPDKTKLRLEIESRSNQYMLSVDSQSKAMDTSTILEIEKADYCIQAMQNKDYSFYETLRKKLLWGVDIRSSNR